MTCGSCHACDIAAMGSAFGWGLLAASSLVIGGVLAIALDVPVRVIGLVMAFGSGVLISAVAFDLVEEASDTASSNGPVIAGLFAGCIVFSVGNWAINRSGGG